VSVAANLLRGTEAVATHLLVKVGVRVSVLCLSSRRFKNITFLFSPGCPEAKQTGFSYGLFTVQDVLTCSGMFVNTFAASFLFIFYRWCSDLTLFPVMVT
jgi:hypothetical protein